MGDRRVAHMLGPPDRCVLVADTASPPCGLPSPRRLPDIWPSGVRNCRDLQSLISNLKNACAVYPVVVHVAPHDTRDEVVNTSNSKCSTSSSVTR